MRYPYYFFNQPAAVFSTNKQSLTEKQRLLKAQKQEKVIPAAQADLSQLFYHDQLPTFMRNYLFFFNACSIGLLCQNISNEYLSTDYTNNVISVLDLLGLNYCVCAGIYFFMAFVKPKKNPLFPEFQKHALFNSGISMYGSLITGIIAYFFNPYAIVC